MILRMGVWCGVLLYDFLEPMPGRAPFDASSRSALRLARGQVSFFYYYFTILLLT